MFSLVLKMLYFNECGFVFKNGVSNVLSGKSGDNRSSDIARSLNKSVTKNLRNKIIICKKYG